MPRSRIRRAFAPFRAKLLSGLGDTLATTAQITAAGYDPYDPNYTYTVDANGNVTPNQVQPVTVSATPIPAVTASQPLWPLLAVLGLIGYSLFWSGKHS